MSSPTSNTPSGPCIYCASRKFPRKAAWGDRPICVDAKSCIERARAK